MSTGGQTGGETFDFGPWRRKRLMAAAGGTLLSLGFVVWIVARWGEVCVDADCWGNGKGSAASVAWAGLAIGLIGLCVLVMGAAMKAPQQVTLVPDGEVNLSKTRVMLHDGWEGGGRPTLLVGGEEVECGLGDEVHVGGTIYTVWAIDEGRQWVTLRPAADDAPAEAATT
jgi:hypothetical protein